MACPAIITGDEFLRRTLAHIDCQAQLIGSYGYQALSQPGSLASTLVTGLLTLFIAFFAIRLLFGPSPGPRDIVFDVLKIGIVLTLAFSWPAFRTLVYDVTLKGPAEIVSAMSADEGASVLELSDRLQQADNAMVRLTETGMGRNTGALIDSEAPGGSFEGTALDDENALGSARLFYLASVIGTLGLLRIGAGLLLALTPVVAGLYFFTQSRGIFAGWLKGLVFTIGGSIGAIIVLTVQLAILGPWLSDALRVRQLGYATPSAPTELFAITLAFAIIHIAMLWLIGRVVFYRSWPMFPDFISREPSAFRSDPVVFTDAAAPVEIVHTDRVSNQIGTYIRREQKRITSDQLIRSGGGRGREASSTDETTMFPESLRLGTSDRRVMSRNSRSSQRRDRST